MKPEFVGGPFRLNWLLYAVLTWLGIIAVLAVFAGLASKALAQSAEPQCAPYTTWSDGLKKSANETEVSFSFIDRDRFIAVFASPHGETWTMLAVGMSTGKACLMAAGTDYYQLTVLKKGEPV